MAFRII